MSSIPLTSSANTSDDEMEDGENTETETETERESPKPIRIRDSDASFSDLTQQPKIESPHLFRNVFNASSDPTSKSSKILTSVQKENRLDFLQKANSYASFKIPTDSIVEPNLKELIRSMTTVLHNVMENYDRAEKFNIEIFSEEKYPIDSCKLVKVTPSTDRVRCFLEMLFVRSRLQPENGVMCMAYINRLLQNTGITLYFLNWRRIVLGALLLASKVWEDSSVWNEDFLGNDFPLITVNDLNEIERTYLDCLKFNVSLHRAEYVKYFLELKAVAKQENRKLKLAELPEDRFRILEKATVKPPRDDLRKTK